MKILKEIQKITEFSKNSPHALLMKPTQAEQNNLSLYLSSNQNNHNFTIEPFTQPLVLPSGTSETEQEPHRYTSVWAQQFPIVVSTYNLQKQL